MEENKFKRAKVFTFLAIAFLALWGFLYVALEVTENKTGDPLWLSADAFMRTVFDSHRMESLTLIMTTFTYLGSTISLAIIAGVALIFFQFKRLKSNRRVLLISASLSILLIRSAKHFFGRIRPDSANWLVPESGLSFPSGHTTASTALLGALFYILGREVVSTKEKTIFWSIGFLIVILISLSRIYLGVHYSTDVLGGILLGSSILSGSIAIDEYRLNKNT